MSGRTRCPVIAETTFDTAGLLAGTACPVGEARRLFEAAAAASCGRDVFCREGTRQVATILADVTTGRGEAGDLDLVEEICTLMAAQADCPMTAGLAQQAVELLHEQADEFGRHLRRSRCASSMCAMPYTGNSAAATSAAAGGRTRRRRRGE